MEVLDLDTGEVRAAQIFVGALGASHLLFAEATWTVNTTYQDFATHYRDRLWLIGGTDEPVDGPIAYHNDVWTSSDGVSWTLVTATAAWEPRRWFNAIAHDGRLWVLNGANPSLWPDEFGNVADIWMSEDGATWRQARTTRLWGARHASFMAPGLDGGFILAAGYGHGWCTRS